MKKREKKEKEAEKQRQLEEEQRIKKEQEEALKAHTSIFDDIDVRRGDDRLGAIN